MKIIRLKNSIQRLQNYIQKYDTSSIDYFRIRSIVNLFALKNVRVFWKNRCDTSCINYGNVKFQRKVKRRKRQTWSWTKSESLCGQVAGPLPLEDSFSWCTKRMGLPFRLGNVGWAMSRGRLLFASRTAFRSIEVHNSLQTEESKVTVKLKFAPRSVNLISNNYPSQNRFRH